MDIEKTNKKLDLLFEETINNKIYFSKVLMVMFFIYGLGCIVASLLMFISPKTEPSKNEYFEINGVVEKIDRGYFKLKEYDCHFYVYTEEFNNKFNKIAVNDSILIYINQNNINSLNAFYRDIYVEDIYYDNQFLALDQSTPIAISIVLGLIGISLFAVSYGFYKHGCKKKSKLLKAFKEI